MTDSADKWNGREIQCARCSGRGLRQTNPYYPDECDDCGGSGVNWQYSGGAIARYYSGPFLCGTVPSEEVS